MYGRGRGQDETRPRTCIRCIALCSLVSAMDALMQCHASSVTLYNQSSDLRVRRLPDDTEQARNREW
ncbi:hypothetical protein ACRALDRAFT_2060431 [Sodiomyces alcalophilus JCM 7366]|uniref:uncharacterized protein n=1 Tax=Sodiomyces alcalophilus JCM 7366 TaxID=591952 RepID=UPI0039B64154